MNNKRNRELTFVRNLIWLFLIALHTQCKNKDENMPISIVSLPVEPNILFILTDDLGNELGFLGDSIARTPHLDKLAEESIVFTNAYVTQSSCSPSRSSILTGQYPHSTGQIGLAQDFSMRTGINTIPDFFKDSEYFTGLIGKLHVEPSSPISDAFDWSKYLDFAKTRDFQITTERISEFLDLKEENPWFLMASVYDPHRTNGKFSNKINGLPTQVFAPEEVNPLPFQQVNHPDQLKDIAGYYNSVERLDEGVGMILKLLEDSNEIENTVIIFLSDHGSPFLRAKTSLYEAGIKVPFMIRIPGVDARKEKAFVSTVDLAPTILDLVGIKNPANDFQGESLISLLNGEASEIRSEIFTEFTYHGKRHYYPRRALRKGKYKLIHNLDTTLTFPFEIAASDNAYDLGVNHVGTTSPKIKEMLRFYINPTQFELYDLEIDPYELSNLSLKEDYKDILEQLKQDLEVVRKEVSDL